MLADVQREITVCAWGVKLFVLRWNACSFSASNSLIAHRVEISRYADFSRLVTHDSISISEDFVTGVGCQKLQQKNMSSHQKALTESWIFVNFNLKGCHVSGVLGLPTTHHKLHKLVCTGSFLTVFFIWFPVLSSYCPEVFCLHIYLLYYDLN